MPFSAARVARVGSAIFLAFLSVGSGGPSLGAEQNREQGPTSQETAFDIPSQDLAGALSAYGVASGMQVLYETSLTVGKISNPIMGTFTPEAALPALLAGTGLVGRRTDVDAITILPDQREPRVETSAIAPDGRFLGALQTGILGVLCQYADTRPGTYRMALQLWITPAGVLERTALLGSTGDPQRDHALVERLRGLPIAAPPPYGMSQPVTLAIVPRRPLQVSECGGE